MVVVFFGLWRDDFQTMAAEVEVAVGGVLARSRSVCLVWASGCLVPARPIAKFEQHRDMFEPLYHWPHLL
eukprot:COSAG02_NODE_141_length_34311_cov_54.733135_20_plen_70_part_00